MIIDVHLTIDEKTQERLLENFFKNFNDSKYNKITSTLTLYEWCKAMDKDSIERFELIEEITREKVYSIE